MKKMKKMKKKQYAKFIKIINSEISKTFYALIHAWDKNTKKKKSHIKELLKKPLNSSINNNYEINKNFKSKNTNKSLTKAKKSTKIEANSTKISSRETKQKQLFESPISSSSSDENNNEENRYNLNIENSFYLLEKKEEKKIIVNMTTNENPKLKQLLSTSKIEDSSTTTVKQKKKRSKSVTTSTNSNPRNRKPKATTTTLNPNTNSIKPTAAATGLNSKSNDIKPTAAATGSNSKPNNIKPTAAATGLTSKTNESTAAVTDSNSKTNESTAAATDSNSNSTSGSTAATTNSNSTNLSTAMATDLTPSNKLTNQQLTNNIINIMAPPNSSTISIDNKLEIKALVTQIAQGAFSNILNNNNDPSVSASINKKAIETLTKSITNDTLTTNNKNKRKELSLEENDFEEESLKAASRPKKDKVSNENNEQYHSNNEQEMNDEKDSNGDDDDDDYEQDDDEEDDDEESEEDDDETSSSTETSDSDENEKNETNNDKIKPPVQLASQSINNPQNQSESKKTSFSPPKNIRQNNKRFTVKITDKSKTILRNTAFFKRISILLPEVKISSSADDGKGNVYLFVKTINEANALVNNADFYPETTKLVLLSANEQSNTTLQNRREDFNNKRQEKKSKNKQENEEYNCLLIGISIDHIKKHTPNLLNELNNWGIEKVTKLSEKTLDSAKILKAKCYDEKTCINFFENEKGYFILDFNEYALNLRLVPTVPQIKQCHNCGYLDHWENECNTDKLCLICCSPIHQGDCEYQPCCINCGGGHGALNKTECEDLMKAQKYSRSDEIKRRINMYYNEIKQQKNQINKKPNKKSFDNSNDNMIYSQRGATNGQTQSYFNASIPNERRENNYSYQRNSNVTKEALYSDALKKTTPLDQNVEINAQLSNNIRESNALIDEHRKNIECSKKLNQSVTTLINNQLALFQVNLNNELINPESKINKHLDARFTENKNELINYINEKCSLKRAPKKTNEPGASVSEIPKKSRPSKQKSSLDHQPSETEIMEQQATFTTAKNNLSPNGLLEHNKIQLNAQRNGQPLKTQIYQNQTLQNSYSHPHHQHHQNFLNQTPNNYYHQFDNSNQNYNNNSYNGGNGGFLDQI
jgi:hypothetical protein